MPTRSATPLAGLDEGRLVEVTIARTGIEEFSHYDDNTVESSAGTVTLLVEPARGARDEGEHQNRRPYLRQVDADEIPV